MGCWHIVWAISKKPSMHKPYYSLAAFLKMRSCDTNATAVSVADGYASTTGMMAYIFETVSI